MATLDALVPNGKGGLVADDDLADEDLHLDVAPRPLEGDGVAVRLHRHKTVRRDPADHDSLAGGRWPEVDRGELFGPLEACERSFMSGTVHPLIGDVHAPGEEVGVQFLRVAEAAAGEGIALDVLHPALDLALGLGPVEAAQTGHDPVETHPLFEGSPSRPRARPPRPCPSHTTRGCS